MDNEIVNITMKSLVTNINIYIYFFFIYWNIQYCCFIHYFIFIIIYIISEIIEDYRVQSSIKFNKFKQKYF